MIAPETLDMVNCLMEIAKVFFVDAEEVVKVSYLMIYGMDCG